MNDHFVTQQLKKLRQINPSETWVSEQRQIIMAQVYNGQEPEVTAANRWGDFWLSFKYLVTQPVTAVSAFLVVALLGGGSASYLASRNAKPGDSMFLAKKINERAQLLAVSFDRTEQNRLKLSIARQRATDMSEVDQEANQQQAEAISREFKQTINDVKERLAKDEAKTEALASLRAKNPVQAPKESATTSDKMDDTFSVASGKDKGDRLEISEPSKPTTRQMLEDAEKLFDNKEYSAAIDKLQTASDLIVE